jgi:hypothetical protein
MQKQIQMAFAKQLAGNKKMIGDPLQGESIESYVQRNFASEDAEIATARITKWVADCAAHQGEASMLFLGEVPGVGLEVYKVWESTLATLHEQWDVIEIPAQGQLPRLRKKVA